MTIDPEILYYVWVALLILGNGAAWITTFLTLPGNWMIVGLTALFVFLVPEADGRGVGWTTVAVVAALAALGELIEFAAGAAGAAKQGASRRAMVLSLAGTVVGSLCGAVIGVPVPIVGPVLGALGGGALGAFLGAYLGETWKGKNPDESLSVGTGALIGRLLGTVGKLAIGAVMFAIITANALL